MAESIRWGILSTAKINDVVIEAIHGASRSTLVGIASRAMEKAKSYAVKRHIPKSYGSYWDLLEDPEIDVVYISLPNTLHGEWTVNAAEAGKHVLCEKPIVTTLEDFSRIEEAAKKYKVTVFEAFMYLHHPQTLKVKELIENGRLGKVEFISSWFNYYLPDEATNNIRVKNELAGGSLWDVGVYPVSFSIIMAMDGAPVEVSGIKKYEKGIDVDVSVYGQMKFANGSVAQISSSIRTPFREGAQIVGRDGSISIDRPWKPGFDGRETQIVLTTKNNDVEVFNSPGVSPYQSEIEAMESCILEGFRPIVPLGDSRNFLRTVLALHESAESGKPIILRE